MSLIVPATFDFKRVSAAKDNLIQDFKPKVVHLTTPEPMRAIYMSQCVVGTEDFRNSLVKFIDETELNAVVIDVKDYSGKSVCKVSRVHGAN